MNDAHPPRITIIIPAHDAADTLDTTLRSLAFQTMADWEAVVIDDGSTDATAEVVQRWMAEDRRIRLLRQRQAGVCHARNAGLEAGRADWGLFLDADDWIAPDYLKHMFAALDGAADAEVACCGYQRVTPNGALLPIQLAPELEHGAFQVLTRNCVVAIHCVVFRRALALAVGGFDPELPVCEDWDLWLRIARTGARFVVVAEALAFYRMRGHSLSCDMVAMARCCIEVMSRARRPDPRVPAPDPRFADGAKDEGLDEARTFILLWCVVAGAAAGQDVHGGLGPVDGLTDIKDYLPDIHAVMRPALLIGAQIGEDRIDEAWERACRLMLPFLDRLEAASTQPGLARRLLYTFELPLLRASRLDRPMGFATALGLKMDIADFRPVIPPAGVDTLHIRFHAGGDLLAICELPVWGELSAEDVAVLAIDTLGYETIRARGAYREEVLNRAAGRAGPTTRSGSSARKAAIIEESRAEVYSETRPVIPAYAPKPRRSLSGDPHSREFWEALFEIPDPWGYDSAYERLKFEQTLSILGDEPVERALELACAEGHFTARLAPRVRRLLASDISQRALDRAARRCFLCRNVKYRRIELADDLPYGFDLTVCSEVLYYLPGEAELRAVAAKLRDTLVPGGRLVHAHAMAIADDPAFTGYEWENPYGGEMIARVLGETEGLALERTIKTELYRIDLFRRVEPEAERPTPRIDLAPFAMPEPEVQRSILWGGAIARQRELIANERTREVPVLMYHRIADDGPEALAPYRLSPAQFEAQLWFLRRHGFYGITSPQIEWYRAQDRPIEGRPVMISFDDAYSDFWESAWPILYRYDFRAEVFVVTDKVGGVADWDAEYGPPGPLMSWEEIANAQARGILFGSHLASHRMAESLTSEELLLEAARSRATLQARLGDECISVAAPYGSSDERLVRILHEAGYHMGFTTRHGLSSFSDHALSLPRIEVRGDWTLADLATALGLPIPPTEA